MHTVHGFNLSTTNSKLGVVPSFDLPAGVTCSASARKTCYRQGCYAVNSERRFPAVLANHKSNYELLNAPGGLEFLYVDMVDYLHQFTAPRAVRLHSSGDFCSVEYLQIWVNISRACPGVRFLAFTKQFDILSAFIDGGGTIPDNLSVILSAWSEDAREIPEALKNNFAIAYCVDKYTTPPAGSFHCPGACDKCGFCFMAARSARVYFEKHGTKRNVKNEI